MLRKELIAAKFMCVLVMVLVHSTIWALLVKDDFIEPIITSRLSLLYWFAFLPLSLPALASTSLRLQMVGEELSLTILLKKYISVSLLLIIIGFLLNRLTCGKSSTFSWDVLPFVGVGFIIISFSYWIGGIWAVFILGLLSLVLYIPLRNIFYDSNNYFLLALIGSEHKVSLWPIFPWFFTMAMGFTVADFRLKNVRLNYIYFLFLALFLVLVPLIFGLQCTVKLDPDIIWGSYVFRPVPSVLVVWLGIFLLLFFMLHFFNDNKMFSKFGIVNSFSRGILWIYLLHIYFGFNIAKHLSFLLPSTSFYVYYFLVMISFSWLIGAMVVFISSKSIVIKVRKMYK